MGTECKNLFDATSKIVLNIELYEGCEFMADTEHVDQVGATTATCSGLTEPQKEIDPIAVRDSQFCYMNLAKELFQTSKLFSIL